MEEARFPSCSHSLACVHLALKELITPGSASGPSGNGGESNILYPREVIKDLWEELYRKRGEGWLMVCSGSMAPLIQVGDQVLVKSCKPEAIATGDIIVFTDKDKLVVHRVIARYKSQGNLTFWHKGDSSRGAYPVSGEAVKGKVVAIQKGDKLLKIDNILARLLGYCLAINSRISFFPFTSSGYRLAAVPLDFLSSLFTKTFLKLNTNS